MQFLTSGLNSQSQSVSFGPLSVVKMTTHSFCLMWNEILWLQIVTMIYGDAHGDTSSWYTGQNLKWVERAGLTLSQDIFKRFWNDFNFVLPMIYNLAYIVYLKYFRVDKISIFIGNVCPTKQWLILWIPLTSKGKAYFSLQWITRKETSLFMPSVAKLILFVNEMTYFKQLITHPLSW